MRRIPLPGLLGVVTLWLQLAGVHELHAQRSAPQEAPRATRDTARSRSMDTVRVRGRIDDLVGVARTASEGRSGSIDLRARPASREGELLETVPGLIVTQHSGDGKANQYFVRGFNLDHGTDFQTRVDGMPVNMPSHGHGQGYTDLNFLIPELVDRVEYKLGVYHAELGDFGSAGGAQFHTVRQLDRGFATLSHGANGYRRFVTGASGRVGTGTLVAGGEAKQYDGPWTLPQELRKLSGLARYSWTRGSSELSILGMAYRNRWNATDQIPRRAVQQGILSRFGGIDSTDGGSAARYSLSASWRRATGSGVREVTVYGVRSALSLYSNFAYFLRDDASGDQFAQRDNRVVLGVQGRQTAMLQRLGVAHLITAGAGARVDLVDGLGLYHTVARSRVGVVREDRVRQSGTGVFAEAESHWTPWLRTVLGARADAYTFHVRSALAENSGDRTAAVVSPKGSLIVSAGAGVELYASAGTGFHSNDARGATGTVNPGTGDSVSAVDPLARSRGAELGVRVSRGRLRATASAWTLRLESELLFVGDEGATEPSAASRRGGVTVAGHFRPHPRLALDADVSFAEAALEGQPRGMNRVPGALEKVFSGGVTWNPGGTGTFGALRARHFGAHALLEDNSVRGRASSLLNGDVGYTMRSGLRIQATVLNLLDAKADDIQYFYTSRLRGEPAGGVSDVHFHPAEPRQVRFSASWSF